jgi:hypothetical protein
MTTTGSLPEACDTFEKIAYFGLDDVFEKSEYFVAVGNRAHPMEIPSVGLYFA